MSIGRSNASTSLQTTVGSWLRLPGLLNYIACLKSMSTSDSCSRLPRLPARAKCSAACGKRGVLQFPETHTDEWNRITRWGGMKQEQSEHYGESLNPAYPKVRRACRQSGLGHKCGNVF